MLLIPLLHSQAFQPVFFFFFFFFHFFYHSFDKSIGKSLEEFFSSVNYLEKLAKFSGITKLKKKKAKKKKKNP
jgi:hypothetical protein